MKVDSRKLIVECVLKLSGMSNMARFFFGGVFILAGYFHVFVDFFYHRNDSKVSEVGEFSFQENALLFTQEEHPSANTLAQELLQNKLSCDAFYATRALGAQEKKLSVATELSGGAATIISVPGELAGARYVSGKIRSNFYNDARNLGVPASVVDRVIGNLSSRIDFKRTLKRGDVFEIIYSKSVMLYSKIVTRRCKVAVYKFPLRGKGGYYFENGVKIAQNTKFNSFVPPLKGRLRVSSPFGIRKHPVYGRNHCHTGVDLSAPYGTPVYAIFDGVVTRASPYHRYGHCVDVRHASGYSSRYGHLSRYAVRCGMRVKKNQLIGYIGASGTSTGAHLHLELAKNNKVINPLSVKMIPDEVAAMPNMRNFNALKKQIEKLCQQPRMI